MTEEEKKLLLIDLCARLPYGFVIHRKSDNSDIKINEIDEFAHFLEYSDGEEFKPYLRPMSSMTEEEVDYDLEEATTLKGLNAEVEYNPSTNRIRTAEYVTGNDIRFGEHTDEYPPIDHHDMYNTIDWLNKHHFDYRGLIEKGLALEAPEDMYK